MTRLCRDTFPFQGRLVISVWNRWRAASYHPLVANKKRRRCTLALDSESPLVHSTQITKLAGSELNLDRRAEEADLICLLTDGSLITHSHPPASHVGLEWLPTARLERARRRRRRWLLLNMKCRSLGMSKLFRSGEDWFSYLEDKKKGPYHDFQRHWVKCCPLTWLSSSPRVVWCLHLFNHQNNNQSKTHFQIFSARLPSIWFLFNCHHSS